MSRSANPYTSINVVPGTPVSTEGSLWNQWLAAQSNVNPIQAQITFIDTILTPALPPLSVESLVFWDEIIKLLDQPVKDNIISPYKNSPVDSAGSIYWYSDSYIIPYNQNIENKLPPFVINLNSATPDLAAQFNNRISDVALIGYETVSSNAVSIYTPNIKSQIQSIFLDSSRLSPIISNTSGSVSISKQAISYNLEGTTIIVDNFFNSGDRTYIPSISSLKA